ncbi:FKBP-type peptidyl-prolyl cis-trans isomerase [Bogoriella caseilytica]|uniref:peptidylprolyl isomerase n=1 Tax=Bogoriella caseilytica TaxID=56055 RepID=A0A3N2B9B2_9MICO|nr:FKBP-type peptidyl-prolyl cis-trans isomerase [Bogoriella caseilytica]ROR71788.1 peptidylprolyl isomerase [Bogoriella caseilytica]
MRTRPRFALMTAVAAAAALTLAACEDAGPSEAEDPAAGEDSTGVESGAGDAGAGGECVRADQEAEEPVDPEEAYAPPASWDDAAPEVAAGYGDDPRVEFGDADEPEGLVVTVLEEGDGPLVYPGDEVVIDYHGQQWGSDEVFDSSFERPDPAVFPLANLIAGWQEGLPGTHAGDRVLLSVPADLAYGEIAGDDGMTEDGRPGGTLAFVIDVHGSFGAASAGQADATETGEAEALPVEIEGALGGPTCLTVDSAADQPEEPTATVIAEGSGEPLEEGDNVVLHFTASTWDNSIEESTWDGMGAETAPVGAGDPFTDLLLGVPSGSRVVLLMPAREPGAEAGSPSAQATAFVVDVVGEVPQR